ncbi:unnamed protein product [Prorocentrum cordatum]|uniref:Uncharacterized protein n=1 Tax=Prorocentrum cordatum TaxID=2364126 RepID=A0ABN9XNW3_9DINO|nr:unnamed protein product [Polarella glacialis]
MSVCTAPLASSSPCRSKSSAPTSRSRTTSWDGKRGKGRTIESSWPLDSNSSLPESSKSSLSPIAQLRLLLAATVPEASTLLAMCFATLSVIAFENARALTVVTCLEVS